MVGFGSVAQGVIEPIMRVVRVARIGQVVPVGRVVRIPRLLGPVVLLGSVDAQPPGTTQG